MEQIELPVDTGSDERTQVFIRRAQERRLRAELAREAFDIVESGEEFPSRCDDETIMLPIYTERNQGLGNEGPLFPDTVFAEASVDYRIALDKIWAEKVGGYYTYSAVKVRSSNKLSDDLAVSQPWLLTRAGETFLSKMIDFGLYSKNPDRRIAGKWAHDMMVTYNTRLAVSRAMSSTSETNLLTAEDLTQIAVIGLDRAVKKFDHRKGFKFSTYATWWIDQFISRSRSYGEMMPINPNTMSNLLAVERSVVDFMELYRRPPTLNEIADWCGFTPEMVDSLLNIRPRLATYSLDRVVGVDGSDSTLYDLVGGGDEIPDLRFGRAADKLREALKVLLTTEEFRAFYFVHIGGRTPAALAKILAESEGRVEATDAEIERARAHARLSLAKVNHPTAGDGPRKYVGEETEDWRRSAACLGVDNSKFFPIRGESTKGAKDICSGCSSRHDCLAYALGRSIIYGIWGGTPARPRAVLAKKIKKITIPSD